MNHKKIISIIFIALILSVSVACAQDFGTPEEPVDIFADFILNKVLPALGAVLLVVVNLVIRWASKKFKTDFLINNQKLIEAAVLNGISYAEEQAAIYLKNRNTDVPGRQKITSNDKMELALNHIMQSVPNVSRTEATKYIQSMLARVQGAGASGDTALNPGGVK